ncbi:hypothetical protein BJY04DRAFT_222988 [Aspergillus karnatakaensis]|uniref:uncharacterized protein n=1 Tax=Aspergillus karnatakaensis TaxID=1810916 RepID=UPI003CCDCC87
MRFPWIPWSGREAGTQTSPQEACNHEGTLLRLNQRLATKEQELNDLFNSNRELHRQLKLLENQHLIDTEKVEQQKHLLCQARDEASSQQHEHREEITKLYNKLNTLQNGSQGLTDEQIQGQMRRLAHNLESWVKTNFKDSEKLATIFNTTTFPRTNPQRRAWVQAFVTDVVFKSIFGPYVAVKQASTNPAYRTWKEATGLAVQKLAAPCADPIFTDAVNYVEARLAKGSTTDTTTRIGQLREFLEKCLAFKETLSRGPDSFVFHCTGVGSDFVEDSMTNIRSDGGPGKVKLSLWPALHRRNTGVGHDIVEPELVWVVKETEP